MALNKNMGIISGEMEPKTPRWLQKYHVALKALGFSIELTQELGAQFSRQVDEVGLEYLKLQLNDPDYAIEAIPEFLHRFRDINLRINFPTNILPEQFGLIINIASRRYETYDKDRMHFLHYQVNSFLRDRNPSMVRHFTAEFRSAEFLRDLVVHNEATNWPDIGQSTSILKNNFDWGVVRDTINLNESNAIMFALRIPEATTDPFIRGRFHSTYRELSQQGINIIAARLYSRGASNEVLRDDAPTQYDDWETTIYKALDIYGEEHRLAILMAIAEEKWHVFDDANLSSQEQLDKMLHTSFALNNNGRLNRQPH